VCCVKSEGGIATAMRERMPWGPMGSIGRREVSPFQRGGHAVASKVDLRECDGIHCYELFSYGVWISWQ